MTTSLYNNLAIQMYPQTLNNRPMNRYGAIFRHVRKDFIDITTRARMSRKTYCMRLNFKKWFCMSIKRESVILITRFCQSIKRKIKKQISLFGGIKLMHYSFFMHNKSPWMQGVNNLSYTKYAPIITITKKISFFIIHLPNLILHAVFTQPEKDSLSFFACWLICSNRSSSNLIIFLVLFDRSVFFLSFFSCIGAYLYGRLNIVGMNHYNDEYHKRQSLDSVGRTSRDLTTITLIEVMIMANSNDTLCPKNGQYDLSNLLSVLNLYRADIQPHNLLHAKAHLEELRQSILWGIGAIGNLLFWASECEEYEEQQFKDDTRDIGYLLAQLKNVVCFASNQINLLDDKLNHKEVNDNE